MRSGGRRGPSLRSVEGNVFSERLPGGNLITAILDRQLMAWSDRGGASRYIGDRWSEQCSVMLDDWIGTVRPVPGGPPFTLDTVIRLDEDPEIAIQAGRHKLTNPDFVLYGTRPDGTRVLQAADAKFAVDTIKPSQVSADALRALLAVQGGLVQHAIEATLGYPIDESVDIGRGIFIGPVSPLTDFFLPRVTNGPRATVDAREVVLIPVDPVAMFSGLPMSRLIGVLAQLDRLSVSPRTHLLSAMYYFRVACACAWMWVEERTPLLSLDSPPELDPVDLEQETSERLAHSQTAFAVLVHWARDVEEITRSRRALSEVASLPIRMREIREMIAAAGVPDERRQVRRVRGSLEQRYRKRLVEEVGAIPARPSRALTDVLQDVAAVTRRLAPELRALLTELVIASRAKDIAAGGSER